MKKVIVVLGPPRSGKNTQAKLLAKKLSYKYLSADDLVAEEIKNKTKIGLIAERYSNSTKKMPDEYLIMLIKDIIINLKEDGIVFNKFPETLTQAKALETFLFSRKTNRPIPILLETEPISILSRIMKENNGDSDSFKREMDLYRNEVMPTTNYYDAIGLKFDTSNKSSEVINEEIIKVLEEKCLLT